MFSIFKKKTVVPHVRLTGVIGSAGRFRQGMDLAGQKDILKKAFSLKKISHVAISINSPGGSPVQSHLIYSYIRELADKTGLTAEPAHLEQLQTYSTPGRDIRDSKMRVTSVAYLAFMPDPGTPRAGSDTRSARFWAVDDLPEFNSQLTYEEGPVLAFDHADMLRDGLERAASKLEYTTLATAFVDDQFTISDLRRVYEAVWRSGIDAANFSRKVKGTTGFIEPTGVKRATGRAPAGLFVKGQAGLISPPFFRPVE